MFYSEAGPFLNVNPWTCADPFSCETAETADEEQCRECLFSPCPELPYEGQLSSTAPRRASTLTQAATSPKQATHTVIFNGN